MIHLDKEKFKKNLSYMKYIIPTIMFGIIISIPFFVEHKRMHQYNTMIGRFPILKEVQNSIGDNNLYNPHTAPFYIRFGTDKIFYTSYEPVKISLALLSSNQISIPENITPIITIKDSNNNILFDIVQQKQITMHFDTNTKIYESIWYAKNTDYFGTLNISVLYTNENSVFSNTIKTEIRKPTPTNIISEAYILLGLDTKETILDRKILSVEGRETTYKGLNNWIKFINADGIIMPSGISKTFRDSYNKYNIWDAAKLRESKLLAHQVSEEKKDVALWIQALELEGNDVESLGYTRSQSQTQTTAPNNNIVSLLDKKRYSDIKCLIEDHHRDTDINFIGLSKIFFDNELHEELYDQFINTFPINMSDTVQKEGLKKWKEYQSVQYVRNLFHNIKKPKFIILDAENLVQNPQQLMMAFAANADFIILDFDIKQNLFENQWKLIKEKSYAPEYMGNIIPSYKINYNNFVFGDSSALENWEQQNLQFIYEKGFKGIRIKDLYQAMFGSRGAYPAYDWLLTIANLASTVKQNKGTLPLVQTFTPNHREIQSNISLTIELKNNSPSIVSNITIDILPTAICPGKNQLIQDLSLQAGAILRTNITLTNITFIEGMLKKRTKFLSLKTTYKENYSNYTQIAMISFTDSKIIDKQSLGLPSKPQTILEESLSRIKTVETITPKPAVSSEKQVVSTQKKPVVKEKEVEKDKEEKKETYSERMKRLKKEKKEKKEKKKK